jgi:pimeloyl-ACP methyl ester carboxylesterase
MKILKRFVLGYFILLLLSQGLSSCLSFRMSQKDLDKAFMLQSQKPSQHQISIQNRTINYAEIGSDSLPVAFFVHGSPGSWSAFVDFMKDETLLQKVKIVSVDRIGFGDSDYGSSERSLETQAALLKPVVERFKKQGKRMILVGHSLGGPLIARMAMDYPQLIDNLVIVAGSIAPDLEPNEKWFRIPLDFLPIRVLVPGSLRSSNHEILYLKPELEKMIPLWKNIKQPTVVIQGGKDNLVHPANADFAQKMLVNVEKLKIIKIDSMNHFVPWSHPQLIKEAIMSSLRE